MSFGLSPWLLAFDLARLAVFVLLVAKGGRWERLLAAMFVPLWLVEQGVLRLPDGARAIGVAGLMAGLLAGQVWLLHRYRPAWLMAATVVQAGSCALSLLLLAPVGMLQGLIGGALAIFGVARLACLVLGVVLRRIGPPAAVPAELGAGADRLGQEEPRRA